MREITTSLTHSAVTVKYRANVPRERRMLCITAFYVEPFVCFRPTVKTGLTSIMERLYYHVIDGVPSRPIVPPRTLVYSMFAEVWARANRILPHVASWSYSEFVASYHGRKRGIYEQAVKRIMACRITTRRVERWSRIRAFIKHEKLPDTEPVKRVVPRMISPRSPEYNVLLGCFLRPMEHHIYTVWQELFESDVPVVAKGVNSVELGKIVAHQWHKIAARGPVAGVDVDQKRFDQHIKRTLLEWEHQWYVRMACSQKRMLRQLVNLQLRSKGVMMCEDGFVYYVDDGSRCSGDMNTACGNVIIMCASWLGFCIEREIPLNEVAVVDNGDDMFLIMSRRYAADVVNNFPEYVSRLGFVLKIGALVYELEHVSFCQMVPINRGDQYVMMREWPRAVAKDIVTVHSCKTRDYYLRYIHDIGVAGAAMCDGLPVVASFYRMLARAHTEGVPTGDVEDSGITMMSRGLTDIGRDIMDVARLSFFRATGCTPTHQVVLERLYDTVSLTDLEWVVGEAAEATWSQFIPTGGRKW